MAEAAAEAPAKAAPPSSGAGDAAAAAAATDVADAAEVVKPIAVVVLGMAGSGKTTLMQRLNAHLHSKHLAYYMVNLDPAVLETPFGAHIDIRDTVNYREVMKQYALGPNGGILTALNLFATKFDQVLGLIGKRVAGPTPPTYALFDTPGQIEIFTWSASGQIITESLAASYRTVIVYVVDTVRCRNAVTFMSNMLYACSILYKLKLPLILAFNKTDAAPCDFATGWMKDLDSFTEALQRERSYMGSLAQSMALMLEEFYANLTSVGVSALSGEGMDDFFAAVDKAGTEYAQTYAVELARQHKERKRAEADKAQKMRHAMATDGLEAAGANVILDSKSEKCRSGQVSKEEVAAAALATAAEEEVDEEELEEEPNSMYTRGACYNAEDEQYAREHQDDEEEYQGLMRYLDTERGPRPTTHERS